MNLYLVADYGPNDLAWSEVEAACREAFEPYSISRVSLPPFDTWACSLALIQLAKRTGRGDVVFHNVAPRRDDTSPRQNNEGEPLGAGWSDRGALFLGPFSGQSWSLVYPYLMNLNRVRCNSGGSQFRSRDIFPQTIPLLLSRAPGILLEDVEPPPLPPGRVLLTDGYGNIKTSLQGDYTPGSTVTVMIEGKEEQAIVGETAFASPEGSLSLARGSSGGNWEIFLRGGSAAALFNYPSGGATVEVR